MQHNLQPRALPMAPCGFRSALSQHFGRPRAASPCIDFGGGFASGAAFEQFCTMVGLTTKAEDGPRVHLCDVHNVPSAWRMRVCMHTEHRQYRVRKEYPRQHPG